MLYKVKNLHGYKLHATDGVIGHVEEFYFDDVHWTIRYLVANTGNWLTGRQVLISPYALQGVNEKEKSIQVALTRDQIEKSPSLDAEKPISRKFEEEYYEYFEWPLYWNGPEAWGYYPYLDRGNKKNSEENKEKHWDVHLMSTEDVTGHRIEEVDGEIGHVSDFVIDDKTWTITNIVVDIGNWLPGKEVFISPKSIDRVDWASEKVYVKLTRKEIEEAA